VAVNAFDTSSSSPGELERLVRGHFPLTPASIIDYLDLRRPIFFETARHGHFGREGDGFTWERTHRVDDLRAAASGLLQAV
jgi:S-adenosylmethionine synthetase